MAVRFVDAPLDPAERVEYECDFGSGPKPVLAADETITTFTVAVTAEAAALGLEIIEAAPRAPALLPGNQGVRVWLNVDPLEQSNPAFDAGLWLGIEVSVDTSSTPSRHRQRTFEVEVKQL
jgi:hypothetical protein